jgi:hypothetical protein
MKVRVSKEAYSLLCEESDCTEVIKNFLLRRTLAKQSFIFAEIFKLKNYKEL